MKKEELVAIIRNAPAWEIDAYFDAAMDRKRELYPNWKILYAAFPTDEPENYRITLEEARKTLEMYAADGQMGATCVK